MHLRDARTTVAWLGFLTLAAAPAPAQEISIGVVPSLFADLTPGQQKFIRGEFPVLVKEFTGLSGKMVEGKSIDEVVDKVTKGTDQFAVFQGVELAWAREKHPELKPLLTAIYRNPRNQAVLVA